MRANAITLCLGVTLLAGCASVREPAYCEGMRSAAREKMAAMPDDDVAWLSTAFSRMYYAGPCACPSDTDSVGNRCGARSAYSRGGGGTVLHCTKDDVPRHTLPAVRELAVTYALPYACGGEGMPWVLNFPAASPSF